ncbi:hypothetical protein CONLIGDRAFT_495180 [Coniochaeta ligniaria NRRL 30616]|uniref:Uncharacterized protein n=1 Tax=Coniochaeta ligniaria NRRL 30616 TaxID=1408157 RepID=A0A1J7JBD0_9PEZI|nr:hypothetical protein CONLIGDRAFT_495180 [Coniochaeta ligniaria NRRL 30616]
MEQHQSRLLALPRELRDLIYREYVRSGTEDGYTYDFEAGKLRTADGLPIDLNLVYTCRLVAAEMEGLALRLQPITFSTLYSEDVRVRAGFWDLIINSAPVEDEGYCLREFASKMTPEMVQEVARRYHDTHFFAIVSRMHTRNFRLRHTGYPIPSDQTFGEVPSVYRRMARDVMQLGVNDPAIYEDLAVRPEIRRERCDPAVCVGLGEEPWVLWKIPTASELDALADQVSEVDEDVWKRETYQSRDKGWGKCRFSAAAAAIHFLSSNPRIRRHIHNIILHEDRESVARPECHAQGLITFCRENPHLRVERRVSLWKNLFLTCYPNWGGSHGSNHLWLAHHRASKHRIRLQADYVTRRVAEYIVEASVPEMPAAITLVLDGDPLPELASHIFRDAVQRDAAWQTALDRTFSAARGAHPDDVFYKRAMACFFFVGFPEVLRAMCLQHQHQRQRARKAPAGRGPRDGDVSPPPPPCHVRCNFDPGEPWDDTRVAAETEETIRRRDAGVEKWWDEQEEEEFYEDPNVEIPQWWEGLLGAEKWEVLWGREDVSYQTTPPLPEYHLLYDETVLPGPLPWEPEPHFAGLYLN